MSIEDRADEREELEAQHAGLMDELEAIKANSDVPMEESDAAAHVTKQLVDIETKLEGLAN